MSEPIPKINKSPKKKDTSSAVLLLAMKYRTIGAKVLFVLGLLGISFLAFYQLGRAPLENWDEAWYADVTRHMMQTKQFFVLYWNEALWLDKPPMYMWVSSLFSSIIGLSEFSVRLPSALSGIIVVMLASRFAYKNYGFVPAFLAFTTLALNNIFIWRMRSGNIDLLATLFIFLIFLVQVSKTKYKYVLLGLLFAGLFLTKASLVLFPFSIFILYEVLFERKQIRAHYKDYGKMIFLALLFPFLWLLIGSIQVGPQFYQYFLFKSDQGVATIEAKTFSMDYLSYMYYSLQRRFTFVLIIGVLFAIRYIKDSKAFLLLMYGGLLLLQLSFTERSNNWYLLPAMPFWSLLIAYGTYHILKIVRNNIFAVILIVAATAFLSYRTFVVSILPVLDSNPNIEQMQSSKALQLLTKEGDSIVRLDHLYPTTVYYSERKVLVSTADVTDTDAYWINRKDVVKKARQKKIRWMIGKASDIERMRITLSNVPVKVIEINKEESILEVL